MTTPARARQILDFWFSQLPPTDTFPPKAVTGRWWKKDSAFDDEIRQRFGADYEDALLGRRDAWLDSPRGRLALIISLDQFGRNMFRGTARAFMADPVALVLALDGLEAEVDRDLHVAERIFYRMPLMHAEDRRIQALCCERFEQLVEESPAAVEADIRYNLGFAERHRDVVDRFGRFPHRNALLRRPCTDEEDAFLDKPGSSF